MIQTEYNDVRRCWLAFWDDYEPGDYYGQGDTKQDAETDLVENDVRGVMEDAA